MRLKNLRRLVDNSQREGSQTKERQVSAQGRRCPDDYPCRRDQMEQSGPVRAIGHLLFQQIRMISLVRREATTDTYKIKPLPHQLTTDLIHGPIRIGQKQDRRVGFRQLLKQSIHQPI